MIMRSPTTMSPSMNHYLSENANMYQYATTVPSLTKLQQQEMFTVCENSSAYESSEDTGVGGLSETELIGAPDGIGISAPFAKNPSTVKTYSVFYSF